MSEVPLLRGLPNPERAQHILDRMGEGWNDKQIVKSLTGRNIHKTVVKVMSDPHGYNTHIDDVLVQRAYEGDREAWVALSHYERKQLVDRLMSRAMQGLSHVRWRNEPPTNGVFAGHGWLSLWCVEVGEAPLRFVRILDKRRFSLRHRAA